jgi:hypothetical protein
VGAGILVAWIGGVPGTAGVRQEGAGADVPTFAADVAPILYRHCAGCHRPGEAAPMSLLTYEDSRPWARAIRNQVLDGSMPPWHADAPPGTFQNERRLTDAEKDVIVRWANGGAPLGDGAALPPPDFPEGWTIGTPDAVFQMAEAFEVPADGWLEYSTSRSQTYYFFAEPLRIAKGSRLESSAWYDNSRKNLDNPDPTVDVRWGDQAWEEMQYTGITFSVAK